MCGACLESRVQEFSQIYQPDLKLFHFAAFPDHQDRLGDIQLDDLIDLIISPC